MSSTELRTGTNAASLPTPAWIGVFAAILSGAVHLRLGIGNPSSVLGISFLAAGVAFFVATGFVLFDYRRRTVYAAGIPFTVVQIVAWYGVNFAGGGKSFPADVGTLGALDKAAQVALIVVLVVLLR